MRKIVCLILICLVIFTGCESNKASTETSPTALMLNTSTPEANPTQKESIPGIMPSPTEVILPDASPLKIAEEDIMDYYESHIRKTIKYKTIDYFYKDVDEAIVKLYKAESKYDEFYISIVEISRNNRVYMYSQELKVTDEMKINFANDIYGDSLLIYKPEFFENFEKSLPDIICNVIATRKIDLTIPYTTPVKTKRIYEDLQTLERNIIKYDILYNGIESKRVENSSEYDVLGRDSFKEAVYFIPGKYKFVFVPRDVYEYSYEFYIMMPNGNVFKCNNKYDMLLIEEHITYNSAEMQKYNIVCADNYYCFEVIKE